MFDPEQARTPGAPLIHPDRTPEDRVAEAHRNVIASFHEGFGGDPDEAALPRAPFVREVFAPRAGHVQRLGALAVGLAALHLGAGLGHAVGEHGVL